MSPTSSIAQGNSQRLSYRSPGATTTRKSRQNSKESAKTSLLDAFDDSPIPKAESRKSKIHFHMKKEDYHRYLAKFASGEKHKTEVPDKELCLKRIKETVAHHGSIRVFDLKSPHKPPALSIQHASSETSTLVDSTRASGYQEVNTAIAPPKPQRDQLTDPGWLGKGDGNRHSITSQVTNIGKQTVNGGSGSPPSNPAPSVNRKKQKRREKQAARIAADHDKATTSNPSVSRSETMALRRQEMVPLIISAARLVLIARPSPLPIRKWPRMPG
ncbi:MAG: hypothetical protein Q9226_008253 [Calogaya cf. arnoldii]